MPERDVNVVETHVGRPAEASELAGLYARHVSAAAALAYLLSGDRHQAEDLAQEAFIRAAGRFRHLRSPDAFGPYLRRTVVNLFLRHHRRRRMERELLARGLAGSPSSVTMPNVELQDELWRALGALPDRQRAALVLRYFEDLTESATAEAMGCSVKAVKALAGRGLRTLRRSMGDEDE